MKSDWLQTATGAGKKVKYHFLFFARRRPPTQTFFTILICVLCSKTDIKFNP